MNEAACDPQLLDALRAGEVVLLNTETLPGLHASAALESSVQRLAELKGSPAGRPFLLLFDSTESVLRYGAPVDPHDADALEDSWPGPLTALLTPTGRAPAHWIHEEKTIAARVPDAPPLRRLIAELGGPLFSTSANRAGEPPAEDLETARRHFPRLASSDLETRPLGAPSTVVDLSVAPGRILRPGAATWPPRRAPGPLS